MRVVRALLAALAALAFLASLVLPEPDSFALVFPALVGMFLLAGAALAVDLVDCRPEALAADLAALLVPALVVPRLVGPEVVFGVVLAAQALPTIANRRAGAPPERLVDVVVE